MDRETTVYSAMEPKGARGEIEVDSRTVGVDSHTIVPRSERKCRDAAVVRSVRLTTYQIAQRGGTNLEHDFAFIGHRRTRSRGSEAEGENLLPSQRAC